ncbi:MAG: ExbD/TolR family protein [Janthinobacterium lividum]
MKNWVSIRKQPMKKARIEIIPMIDTIFFLLVFFMFTSLSMVKMKGMDISLPKDSNAVSQKPPPQVVITIDQAGNYFLNTAQIQPDQLQTEMQNRINVKPDTVFIVNVNKSRQTQDIITVMDAVNGVQIPGHPQDPVGVMIATSPVNPDGTAATQ